MKTFKKILCPVDLTDATAKLIPYVNTMAEKFGAEIHFLFVARVFESLKSIYVPHPSINLMEKEMVTGAQRRIEEFLLDHYEGRTDIRTAVKSGDAPAEIVRYVNANGIDLVIMGTHGRKGLEKAIFGSVAERTVRVCPVPVFLVNTYMEAADIAG